MTAQILLVLEKWCFYDFFYFFFKNLRYKKINRTSISQPNSGVLLGYNLGFKSGVSICLLKSFWFSRNSVFIVFFCSFFFVQKTWI